MKSHKIERQAEVYAMLGCLFDLVSPVRLVLATLRSCFPTLSLTRNWRNETAAGIMVSGAADKWVYGGCAWRQSTPSIPLSRPVICWGRGSHQSSFPFIQLFISPINGKSEDCEESHTHKPRAEGVFFLVTVEIRRVWRNRKSLYDSTFLKSLGKKDRKCQKEIFWYNTPTNEYQIC